MSLRQEKRSNDNKQSVVIQDKIGSFFSSLFIKEGSISRVQQHLGFPKVRQGASHFPTPLLLSGGGQVQTPGPGVHGACCHAVVLMTVPYTAACSTLSRTKMTVEQELRRGLVKTQWSPLHFFMTSVPTCSKLIKTGSSTKPEIATKQRCPPQTWNTLLIIQKHTYSYHK